MPIYGAEAPPDTLEKLQTITYAEDNFGDEAREWSSEAEAEAGRSAEKKRGRVFIWVCLKIVYP